MPHNFSTIKLFGVLGRAAAFFAKETNEGVHKRGITP